MARGRFHSPIGITSGIEKLQSESAPTDSTFQLIGDCYLHGFMHGEMLVPNGA